MKRLRWWFDSLRFRLSFGWRLENRRQRREDRELLGEGGGLLRRIGKGSIAFALVLVFLALWRGARAADNKTMEDAVALAFGILVLGFILLLVVFLTHDLWVKASDRRESRLARRIVQQQLDAQQKLRDPAHERHPLDRP
jgi:hypothetical protein